MVEDIKPPSPPSEPPPPPAEPPTPPPPPPTQPVTARPIEEKASGRAIAALVLGIAGIVCFTPLAIVAWILGSMELKSIATGQASAAGQTLAKIGWILGIIGTILMILGIIITIILVILGVFTATVTPTTY